MQGFRAPWRRCRRQSRWCRARRARTLRPCARRRGDHRFEPAEERQPVALAERNQPDRHRNLALGEAGEEGDERCARAAGRRRRRWRRARPDRGKRRAGRRRGCPARQRRRRERPAEGQGLGPPLGRRDQRQGQVGERGERGPLAARRWASARTMASAKGAPWLRLAVSQLSRAAALRSAGRRWRFRARPE